MSGPTPPEATATPEVGPVKAIQYDHYGTADVLKLRELPDPSPGPGQVVVDVHALALNPKDVLVRKGKFDFMPWVKPPIIPGHDLAGVVSAVGPGADLHVVDEVFGWVETFHGGASAERVAISAQHLALRPRTLHMAGSASLPLAALTSLQALRDDLRIQPGEHLLVHGASGGVGVFAIQLARHMGARVTAVCSARNRELVLSLGAHEHVDYNERDPTSVPGLDAIFDVFGNIGWQRARAVLPPHGRFCTTLPRPRTVALGLLARVGLSRASLVVVRSRRADLEALARLVDAGQLRPVIDRELPWTAIADGHRHVETKRTRGKVVLRVR